MIQARRGGRYFVAYALCGMLIVGIAVLVYWRVKFDLAYKEAWSVYAESRGGRTTDTSSRSFAIREIQFGDTEEEVDRRMKGAAQSQKLEPAPSDPEGTMFVKFYTFSYRPGLDYPVADKDYEFVSETFFVFFDEQGRAFQVKRRLFVRNDAEQTGTTVYDLPRRKVTNQER